MSIVSENSLQQTWHEVSFLQCTLCLFVTAQNAGMSTHRASALHGLSVSAAKWKTQSLTPGSFLTHVVRIVAELSSPVVVTAVCSTVIQVGCKWGQFFDVWVVSLNLSVFCFVSFFLLIQLENYLSSISFIVRCISKDMQNSYYFHPLTKRVKQQPPNNPPNRTTIPKSSNSWSTHTQMACIRMYIHTHILSVPLSVSVSLSLSLMYGMCSSGAVSTLCFVWKFSCIMFHSLIHAYMYINNTCNLISIHQ